MLSKFLDPKNDVAFKKIFGTEKNKDILIHFLNDMITFKERRLIQEVAFLKTNQDPETAAKKTSIVDILCKDDKGNMYIVEMQVAKEKGFEKTEYYASKAYISQTHTGGHYQDLKEVIFLAIADFIMFPQKKEFKSDHAILNRESHENDLRDFSFTFLELPKFNKDVDHLSNMIEKWSYFFKHAEETSKEELQKLIIHDPIIERAYEELNRFGWNETELLTYDQAEKYEGAYHASLAQQRDEGRAEGKIEGRIEGEREGRIKGKREGRIEGKMEGRIEGKMEGMVEGRVEGRIEGIKEGEKTALLKVAQSMLKQGQEIHNVKIITGLSDEELESLPIEIPPV